MKLKLAQGKYKSLSQGLQWENIPSFAILTGENGTGKTQLLELIDLHYAQTAQSRDFKLLIQDVELMPEQVVYLPNIHQVSGIEPASLVLMEQDFNNLKNLLRTPQIHDRYAGRHLNELRKKMDPSLLNNPHDLTHEWVETNLDVDLNLADPTNYERKLGKSFLEYRLDYMGLLEKGNSPKEITAKLGQKPWEVLNAALSNSGFRYKLTSREHQNIRDLYTPRAIDVESGNTLEIRDLSTGEATILKLYIWLFAARTSRTLPRLVLLDEPDAYLHPSLIPSFLDNIRKGIVESLGARVIMTTHRSETILSADQDSIFEMHRLPPRLRTSTSKEKSIALITGNFISVVETKKIVYVEDEADVQFYKVAKKIADEDYCLAPKIGISFIPASLNKGKSQSRGGKVPVKEWVRRFVSCGMNRFVVGLIDGDNKNDPLPENIYRLNRYSFENYLIDPIILYCILVDRDIQRPCKDIIRLGEESTIRHMGCDQLQSVADAILSNLEMSLPTPSSDEKSTRNVAFGDSIHLQYPVWLFTRRGHDLVNAAVEKWKFNHVADLTKALERLRLLPDDLLDVFREIIR